MNNRVAKGQQQFVEQKKLLKLKNRYTFAEIVKKIQNSRKRKLRILRVSNLPLEVTGLWVKTPEKDYILCPSQASQVHLEHIILHELSHMLLGHRPIIYKETTQAVDEFIKSTAPDAIARLSRSVYSRPEEYEAELLATLFSSELDTSPTKNFWESLRSENLNATEDPILSDVDDWLRQI